jgi:2-polyprenyl-3-methyl-5-hydroxy-6-metoxy-1,4-benzoquinol methylase
MISHSSTPWPRDNPQAVQEHPETPKYWRSLDEAPTIRAELDLVPDGARVLEIGTAAGHVTRALAQKGCAVVGVEMDAKQASLAAPACHRMLVGNVEELDLDQEVSDYFDVVLCGDVLEHLNDPGAVLQKLRRRLAPDGYLVVSIPNIAHGSVRLSLMEGQFAYTEYGLLDATHIRFFTLASLIGLFNDNGLFIRDMRRIRRGLFECEIPIDASRVNPSWIARLVGDSEATSYQFVFRALPSGQKNTIVDLEDPSFDPVQARRVFAAEAMTKAWIDLHSTPPRLSEARVWARLALQTSPTVRAALYWSVSFLPRILWRR